MSFAQFAHNSHTNHMRNSPVGLKPGTAQRLEVERQSESIRRALSLREFEQAYPAPYACENSSLDLASVVVLPSAPNIDSDDKIEVTAAFARELEISIEVRDGLIKNAAPTIGVDPKTLLSLRQAGNRVRRLVHNKAKVYIAGARVSCPEEIGRASCRERVCVPV